MSKDPTPRADALRAQREARYGHLQAKATPPRKLIPYAGKEAGARDDLIGNGGAFRSNPQPELTKPPRKRVKRKRKIA